VRALLLVAAAAGCGKIGFADQARTDAGTDSAGGADGSSDAALRPTLCNARLVTTLPIQVTEETVAIRAVALPARYAIAVETDAVNIPFVELDASGAFIAHHGLFTPGYAPLHGIAKLVDRPIVGLEVGTQYYVKLVDPGWEEYTTGPSGEAGRLDPPIAAFPGETSAAVATLSSGTLQVWIMDPAGFPVTPADYQPAGIVGGSLTSTPGGARVVAASASGTCETFFLSPAGVTGPKHSFGPCFSPLVAALDDTTGLVLHRTAAAGPFALHEIPANAADAGTTSALPGATYARIAARGGAYWIGHGNSTSGTLKTIRGGAASEHTEARPTFPFDFTERDLFWIDGPRVYAATPCEQ
jgi:hypothetical protein